MKILVIGSTGMIGSHIVAHYKKQGCDVVGLARSSSSSRLHDRHDYPIKRCDITDRGALRGIFADIKPDVIVHMAAQAFNGASWEIEDYTYQANVMGVLNVLHAAREASPSAKVLLACSSAEYGDVKPEDCPLIEERPLRPITPYGVSKAAGEHAGYQHFCNYGMQVYLPRLFIHVGTGHPPATAIQNFAMQLALIKKGKRPAKMHVGRLDTARDFIDVRDGVAGIALLLEKGRPGVATNICNGVAVSIREVLDILLKISDLKVEITTDKNLLRPSDEPLLLGNNDKLKSLGWKRRYTIEETLGAVFEDWLNRV